MDAKQLRDHHNDANHFRCIDPECDRQFHTKNNMYAHYKAKHDSEVYKNGVIALLEAKLRRVESRIERKPLAAITLQEKKSRLLGRLSKLKCLSVEEVIMISPT